MNRKEKELLKKAAFEAGEVALDTGVTFAKVLAGIFLFSLFMAFIGLFFSSETLGWMFAVFVVVAVVSILIYVLYWIGRGIREIIREFRRPEGD